MVFFIFIKLTKILIFWLTQKIKAVKTTFFKKK